MIRVIKPEGFGNIQLEDVPVPEIGPREVLVRTKATLISRGSELFARYNKQEAVSPSIMGYSLAGVVERVGPDVTSHKPGDRVMVVAPHAQYAVGGEDAPSAVRQVARLTDDVSFEEGTFLPLVISTVLWCDSSGVRAGDTVVVMGQGLVGSLMLQALRDYQPGRLIAVDALPLRCEFAKKLGADEVINAAAEDPVAAVRRLTANKGADVVIECVGGNAGVKSFEQALEMVRQRGTLQLISLYQGAPLPLNSSRIMNKRLLAGILVEEPREKTTQRALEKIRTGRVKARDMITHRFPYAQAKHAFDLLWNAPGETLGVVLVWE